MRALIASAVAVLAASAATPAAAQQSPVPFDAQRGVFTFATGLERALPAVVQVTTLGQSEGLAAVRSALTPRPPWQFEAALGEPLLERGGPRGKSPPRSRDDERALGPLIPASE